MVSSKDQHYTRIECPQQQQEQQNSFQAIEFHRHIGYIWIRDIEYQLV
jgi:hypothetical protein